MIPELETYLRLLEDLRAQVGAVVSDLPADALNWRPIEGTGEHSTNSLGVLVAHVAGAEHFWIGEVVGGRPPTRDRDSEFTIQVSDASDLGRLLQKTGLETRDVLSALSDDDLGGTREARGRTVSVRWCILHVVHHTALHLGHMQLTYQLWTVGRAHTRPAVV